MTDERRGGKGDFFPRCPMDAPQGFGLFFMFGGGLCLLSAGEAIARRWTLLSRAVRAEGRVVHLERDDSTDSDIVTVTPTVRYKTADGVACELKLHPTSDPDRWKVGDAVSVLYAKGDPTNAVAAHRRWRDVVNLTVMGLLCFGIGAACYFLMVDPHGRPPPPPAHEARP
jgi:hypothetical protein